VGPLDGATLAAETLQDRAIQADALPLGLILQQLKLILAEATHTDRRQDVLADAATRPAAHAGTQPLPSSVSSAASTSGVAEITASAPA